MKIFGLLLFSFFWFSCERAEDKQVSVKLESALSFAAVSNNFSLDKNIQKKLYRQSDTVLGRLYLESLVEKRVFVSMEEVSDYYKKTKNQYRRTSREFLVMRFITTNKDTAQYVRRVLMKKNESQKGEEAFGLLVERLLPSRELIKEESLREPIKKQFLGRKGGPVVVGPLSAGDVFVILCLLKTYEKGTIKDLIHIQDDVRSKIYSTKAHLVRRGLADSLSVLYGANTK